MTMSAVLHRDLPQDDSRPSAETLLARAKAMGPAIRARADLCEQLGRTPPETVDDFEAAGFYKICQPRAYGGYEHDPMVLNEVVAEIARHCPSSAWALGIVAIHNWEVGICDPRLAQDMWGEDPTVRSSASYGPFGTATPTEGGYILRGKWSWSSGCDQATWVILGAVVEVEPDVRELVSFYVAPGDYRIDHDSWNSAGLTGTGSKDIIVEDAFVPAYRMHNVTRAGQPHDRSKLVSPADTYQLPWAIVLGYSLVATFIGIAEGALDHTVNYLKTRTGAFDGKAFKEDPVVQQILAEAYADLDTARLKMYRDFAEMRQFVARDEPIPVERRVLFKWNLPTISRICCDVVNRLMRSSGGSAFANSNQMQRYFRDVNIGVNHAFLTYQNSSKTFGKFLLTGEVSDPMV